MGPAPTRLPLMAFPPPATLVSFEVVEDQLPVLSSSPRPTTQANHTKPIPMVMRSRLRSATEDPPTPLETPPPNMSESPPPRPLCSSTMRISSKLEMTSKTSKTITTGWILTDQARWSEDGHVVEPADATELVGLQAGTSYEAPVDVGLLHDAGHVGGLHRAPVEDADPG